VIRRGEPLPIPTADQQTAAVDAVFRKFITTASDAEVGALLAVLKRSRT
jgi:hypothetical protein